MRMKNGIGAPLKIAPGGLGSLPGFHVLLHDVPGGIDIVSVQTGGVILVFLRDLVVANRRVVTFSTGRHLGFAHENVGLVKIGSLFFQIDFDGGRSLHAVPIPIGDRVVT